jgi:DNA invertase Pin-like site-specific DNA recombinase
MARSVRAVSAKPRAILYLRQSTYREESISLELQEHEGRAHAVRHGYDVVGVESDPGISGRTWNRPAVQRVMQMIENHEADVIVLWKWSRLSRSRLDWAVAADRVETAGGRIESATEPLDVSTSTGRLARGMLTEFAAFESERIGDVWREAHARRNRLGLPANGKPRFGYLYADKTFTPDPLTAPVLAAAYRAYIAGESVYSLVKTLNDGPTRPVRGYGVSGDGLWSDRTLRRVLDSGFAAGYIRAQGELVTGAHDPIISEPEWLAYLEARGRRRHLGRTERSEYLLSGLVRCSCGSAMTAGQFGAQHVAKYRCKAAHDKRTHSGGYVTASLVEEYATRWLFQWIEELNAAADEAARAPQPRAVKDPAVRLRVRETELLARIDSLGATAAKIDMPRDSYQRQLGPLQVELGAIRAELLTAIVRPAGQLLPLPGLLDAWEDPDATVAMKRELLRSVLDHVIVSTGRPHATFEAVPRA